MLEEHVYPVEERLTIGRSPINVVHLADPSVSRRHAVLYPLGGKIIVEDLGSQNGTFVNGERIRKAALQSGDTLRIGSVCFRYREEMVPEDEPAQTTQEILKTTQELLADSDDDSAQVRICMGEPEGLGHSRRSKRLSESLSRVPLFAGLKPRDLAGIAQSARLLVFDRGRTVFRQGDRGNSIYVILDGKAKVVTYDHEGRELQLAVLEENHFFGEMSFLSGNPRNATVQVIEESLLCELSFPTMRDLVARVPEIRKILQAYYHERIKDMEAKKKAAGLVDRRKEPRLNERVPVSFSISPTGVVASQFKGRVFRSMSQDISLRGVRVKAQDRVLLGLPAGCQVRLEIALPRGWGVLRALGTLRNIVEGKEGGDLGYLGIEFQEMASGHRKKLQDFIRGEALDR